MGLFLCIVLPSALHLSLSVSLMLFASFWSKGSRFTLEMGLRDGTAVRWPASTES